MAYGHAERNLALIRQLEAETSQLLGHLAHQEDAAVQPEPTEGRPVRAEVADTVSGPLRFFQWA